MTDNWRSDQLLRRARGELDCAHESTDETMRFLHAHMAAIRSASAVLALTAPGPRRRGRVLSVWEQLAEVEGSWQAWAASFAAAAPVRAAIESGRVTEMDAQQAEDALRRAEDLFDEVALFVREAAGRALATPIAS